MVIEAGGGSGRLDGM